MVYQFHYCLGIPKLPVKVCLHHKSHNAASKRHSLFYQVLGTHETKLTVEPGKVFMWALQYTCCMQVKFLYSFVIAVIVSTGHTNSPIQRIQTEITFGHKAASKVIALVDVEKHEGEQLEQSEIIKRLRLVLGIKDHITVSYFFFF